MSKIKGPKVKRKTARKAKRATSRTKHRQGFFSRIASLFGRFSRAALAGMAVAALAGLAILWSGGYFGLLGEKANEIAGAGARSAGFEIKRITVRGLDQTSEQDLLAAIGPIVGTSIVHFDPFSARARVEDLGWVRSAAVSRLLPDTVHVSVREREPAAVWQMSGALHLIDQNGAIIREIGAYEYANLPMIVGAGAPGAASSMLQALRAEPDLWGRASALIRVGDRRWNLRVKDGYDIKFPEEGYEHSVAILARLQEKTGLLDENLEYVDLRNPENFVYRRKGATEDDFANAAFQ